jgi:uncharacterized membrane protein
MEQQRNLNQTTLLQITSLVIIGLLFRVPYVGITSLWFDEGISFIAAQMTLSEITTNVVQSSHPPLYYLLLKLWFTMFSATETSGRILNVLLNVSTIPFIYLIADKIFHNKKTAFFSSAFFATNTFFIHHSLNLRMYPLLTLLSCMYVHYYLHTHNSDKQTSVWTLTLLATALLYTHFFSLLFLTAFIVHSFLYRKENTLVFKKTFKSILLTFISFIPWLFVILNDQNPGQGTLRPLGADSNLIPFSYLHSIHALQNFLFYGIQHSSIVYFSSFLILSFAYIIYVKAQKEAALKKKFLILFFLILFFVLGVPNFIYLAFPFFLSERTMIASLPFLLILLAWTASLLNGWCRIIPALYLAISALCSIHFISNLNFSSHLRETITYISSSAGSNQKILHLDDFTLVPSISYSPHLEHFKLKEHPQKLKADLTYKSIGANVTTIDKLNSEDDQIWLVYAPVFFPEWQQETLDSLSNTHEIILAKEFNGIRLFSISRIKSGIND